MRITLWVGLLTVGAFSVVEEPRPKPALPAPQRAVCLWDRKQMELEGVLSVRDPLGPITRLAIDQKVVVANSRSSVTGASVYLENVGRPFDVYLPNDQLKKLAQELNGQRVKIAGEGRRMLVVPAEFGDLQQGTEVPVGQGKTLWFPDTEFREMPTMRFLIWAKDIKISGPKREPLLGEPSGKTVFRFDWTTYTYQRLPRAREVMALSLERYLPHGKPPEVPLTAANFPSLLDSMKPIRADDEKYTLWHYGRGGGGAFETAEGKFHFYLYPGGLARLQAPDGRIGFATFERPQ